MSAARERIEHIYRDAVAAVDPRTAVRDALAAEWPNQRSVFDTESAGSIDCGVYTIAIGKAGIPMTQGAFDALGEQLRAGIIVTKQVGGFDHPAIELLAGSHPVPDQSSLDAGQRVIEFVRAIPADALVVCLISGGGSALVEALAPGVTLDKLQEVTSRLLRAGASIHELNSVRSRLSRLKGGGLLEGLRHTRLINLIVSDVLGDDLEAIASGPSVPASRLLPAERVLAKYSIEIELPPPPERTVNAPPRTRIVANLDTAIAAATLAAQPLGLNPVVLTNRLDGEARIAGALIASILALHDRPFAAFPSGTCLIAGGETTVTVRGSGAGGRNTEAALAAALRLKGTAGVTVGFLATDGDDGVTGAAGAIVDGATIPTAEIERAREALAANDSFGMLSATGAVWSPGATGTNVNDLVIGIVE
jgi:hydroxypyruvate reductase